MGPASPQAPLCPPIAGHSNLTPTGVSDPIAFRQRIDRALGLARHGDFARFWAAQATSAIGSQFTAVALPLLAALSLGASPMAFGVLAAAAGLPHLLFGLFAGAWVDRLRRRPVMIAADIARAVLLATIPLAAALGVLRIELLVAVAFLVETFTVFFDIAYLTYIPSLVSRERTHRGQQPAGSDRVRRAGDRPRVGRNPGARPWRATGAGGRRAVLPRLGRTHLAHPRP